MEQSYLKNILEKKGIPNKQVEVKIHFGKKEPQLQPQPILAEESEDIQSEVGEVGEVEETEEDILDEDDVRARRRPSVIARRGRES